MLQLITAAVRKLKQALSPGRGGDAIVYSLEQNVAAYPIVKHLKRRSDPPLAADRSSTLVRQDD